MTVREAYEGIREFFSREGAVLGVTTREACGSYCVYRGPNGERCAVGCLIPDEAYDSDFDTEMGQNACDVIPVVWPEMEPSTARFLQAAQDTHDGASSVESFLDRLDVLYREWYVEAVPA